jgi:hypothetical protein
MFLHKEPNHCMTYYSIITATPHHWKSMTKKHLSTANIPTPSLVLNNIFCCCYILKSKEHHTSSCCNVEHRTFLDTYHLHLHRCLLVSQKVPNASSLLLLTCGCMVFDYLIDSLSCLFKEVEDMLVWNLFSGRCVKDSNIHLHDALIRVLTCGARCVVQLSKITHITFIGVGYRQIWYISIEWYRHDNSIQ